MSEHFQGPRKHPEGIRVGEPLEHTEYIVITYACCLIRFVTH